MKEPVYLVEEISKVVDATRAKLKSPLYYLYGHPTEVVQRLQELSNSVTQKDKKFPLIALFTDITIEVGGDTVGLQGSASLQLIIATSTEQNYTAPQRLENSFKPVLYPIRNLFLDELYHHRQFTYDGDLQFSSTDRYYWGRQGLYGSTGNMFNDYIDAIELQNVRVNIKNKFC